MTVRLIIGDCRDVLKMLPDASVHCVVTSPPYWGLRDYGTAKWEGGDAACDHAGAPMRTKANINRNCGTGDDVKNASAREFFRDICGKCGAVRIDSQLGLEKTPDEYVAKMVEVFRDVRRVLREDGTLWLNLGDSYAGSWGAQSREHAGKHAPNVSVLSANQVKAAQIRENGTGSLSRTPGLKPKDLVGIPWRVAFALQADGWYLRSDIIWHKPNPMPESVTDRPTKAHEYLFLLTKSASYFYDADAIAEPSIWSDDKRAGSRIEYDGKRDGADGNGQRAFVSVGATRNRRSVWTVATRPYKGAHFATFPPKLIEPCVLAGTSPQACEHCAAPWERVVERLQATPLPRNPNGTPRQGAEASRPMSGGGIASSTLAMQRHSVDMGFAPTCDCADNTGSARCVVLDPFGGAGTTGLVTDRLGRDSILIELSEDHIDQSLDRITDDAPLFANVHVRNGNGSHDG